MTRILSLLSVGILMLYPLYSHSQTQDAQQNQGTLQNDVFIQGYASALLQKVHQLPAAEIYVENGKVILDQIPEDADLRATISGDLQNIEGVRDVQFQSIPKAERNFFEELERSSVYRNFFPDADLFTPLIASPFESRIELGFRPSDESSSDFGVAKLGDTFGLYRWDNLFGGDHTIQLNIEGNIAGYFDLDASSSELQNVEFQVALPVVYRYHDFSARVRLLHRSAHLGDEFIVNNALSPNEIFDKNTENNLTDLVLSYEKDWWRVFLGGTYVFDEDPERDPWDIQYGAELTPWNERSIHPIVAVWFRQQAEFNWKLEQRYMAGVEFNDFPFHEKSMRVLGEYYQGKSLQDPFILEDGDFYGVTVQIEF